MSSKIKMNLRPLFNALEFTCAMDEMSKSVEFLKQHLAYHHAFKSYRYNDVPMGFFPKSARKFLTYKARDNHGQVLKKIDGNRYEFMVYLQLFKGLADGTVFVKDCNGYRALEDELIDIEYWTNHKHTLLAELNMPLLSMNITALLDRLETCLEQKYIDVNQRIETGENATLKLRYNKRRERIKWTLPYVWFDDGINNPFYEKLPVSGMFFGLSMNKPIFWRRLLTCNLNMRKAFLKQKY